VSLCLKGIGLHAQTIRISLSSIVNMIGFGGGGGKVNRCDRLNEHGNLHFDNE
jgi:hypothetical protein